MGTMNNVKCIPFPGIENSYIVISGYKSDTAGNGVKRCLSFFYGTKEKGAEWEPENGPITIYHPCEKNHENATPHWFYPYCTGHGNWSQLAVKEWGLPDAFIESDYNHIFSVLRTWAENN